MSQWRDISTAPKDGTRIWVAEVSDEYINTFEARWCTLYGNNDIEAPKVGGFMTCWWALSWRVGDREWPGVADQKEHSPYGRASLVAAHPTHWMPLPHEPDAQNAEETAASILAATAAEREACAVEAEQYQPDTSHLVGVNDLSMGFDIGASDAAEGIASAIRKRGEG